MQSYDFVTGLKAKLKAERAALRRAVADPTALAQSLTNLSELMKRIGEHVDSIQMGLTAAEFDNGVMGATSIPSDPAIEEAANTLLTLAANGLSTFCSATRFTTWCRTADLSGSVAEIRERFFEKFPLDYLSKSVCRHLLAAQGIVKE